MYVELHQRLDPTRILKLMTILLIERRIARLHQRLDPTRILKPR